jgi:hypothetical protein
VGEDADIEETAAASALDALSGRIAKPTAR